MSIPEGATHKAIGPRIDCWYKNINCLGFEFMNQGGSEWIKRDGMPNWPYERIANEQPKQWSGPEDGLPPVGFHVRIEMPSDDQCADFWRYGSHIGKNVDIIAHQVCSTGENVAVYAYNNDGILEYHSLVAHCFRALKSPKQIAAEKRETAIRELMDIAQVDCRVTAARLVDAGFKR